MKLSFRALVLLAALVAGGLVLGGARSPRRRWFRRRNSLGMMGRGGGGRPYPYAIMGGEQTWTARSDDYVTVWTSGNINLPDTGYHLVKVAVVSSTTPGAWTARFDGVTVAQFPCPSNGTLGQMSWAVRWDVQGATINSGILSLVGGVSKATLTFSKDAGRGPSIYAYRCIRFTVTTAATHSAFTAFSATNYDVGPALPRAMYAFGTTGDYLAMWPTVATAQGAHNADSVQGAINLAMAPVVPTSLSLTPGYENPNTAAGTLDLYVFYDPVK